MEKNLRFLLVIAGVISLLFSVFHVLFFVIFNWKETLSCLDHNNWAIFHTFNLVSILMVLTITYFSLFKTKDLLTNRLASPLLFVFSLYLSYSLGIRVCVLRI
jgi:hypothetical protein